MRIGQALMASACAVSGVVVFFAGAASAQSYTSAPTYQGAGYQRSYSAGLQASYRGGYTTDELSGGYYLPPDRGYEAPVSYGDYDRPSYQPPRYEPPTYGQPRYDRPVYRPPVVIEPATCHDRGW